MTRATIESRGKYWVVSVDMFTTRFDSEAVAVEWFNFFTEALKSFDLEASCEQCGSHDVHLHDSQRRECRETGYVDGGHFWRCTNCRAEWEAGVVTDHAGDAADLRYRQAVED